MNVPSVRQHIRCGTDRPVDRVCGKAVSYPETSASSGSKPQPPLTLLFYVGRLGEGDGKALKA